MAEKKYDFPVLLDDGYVSANGINSFPTTWFLDPEGVSPSTSGEPATSSKRSSRGASRR